MSHLPQDLIAEQTLAAIAAISNTGATQAFKVLEHILDPHCRSVIRAAYELDADLADLPYEQRLNTVALTADLPRSLLDQWIAGCPAQWDSTGTWRQLVTAAAERRQRALQLGQELEQLVGPIRLGRP